MIKKKCPICENNSTNIIYNRNLPKTIDESNYAGRKPPDYYHYEMVRCTKCKILYANSIYDEVTIEKLYNDKVILDHGVEVGKELANVLSGGDTTIDKTLSEDDLYKLELDAFMRLIETQKTQDRIKHTLATGKPLVN